MFELFSAGGVSFRRTDEKKKTNVFVVIRNGKKRTTTDNSNCSRVLLFCFCRHGRACNSYDNNNNIIWNNVRDTAESYGHNGEKNKKRERKNCDSSWKKKVCIFIIIFSSPANSLVFKKNNTIYPCCTVPSCTSGPRCGEKNCRKTPVE